jgi:hypothetical protein
LEIGDFGGIIARAKSGGCFSVTRSAKLGITSLLLLGSIFVPPFAEWRQPISFASAVLSCVFGALAALQGSKWWLAIPITIAVAFAVILYLAAHSF